MEMYGVEGYDRIESQILDRSSISFDGENKENDKSTANLLADERLNGTTRAGASIISSIDSFNEAYDCLGMRDEAVLQKGINVAIELQRVCLILLNHIKPY